MSLERLARPLPRIGITLIHLRLAHDTLERRCGAQRAGGCGLFAKGEHAVAFSKRGPLAVRFPRSQSVRFHLGELSLWIGLLQEARRQLNLAYADGPQTTLGKTAREFLALLPKK